MYETILVCGYRRPNNLRDRLVRANIPFIERDEEAMPENSRAPQNHTLEPVPEIKVEVPDQKKVVHKSITDFFHREEVVLFQHPHTLNHHPPS